MVSPSCAGRPSAGISVAVVSRSTSSSWSTRSDGISGSARGTSSFFQSATSGFGWTATVAVKRQLSAPDSGSSYSYWGCAIGRM